jgi:hypothetical protein
LVTASSFASASLALSSSVVEATAVSEAAASEDSHLHTCEFVLDFLGRVTLQDVQYNFRSGKVGDPLAVAGLLHGLDLLCVFCSEELRLHVVYGVGSGRAGNEADKDTLRGLLRR